MKYLYLLTGCFLCSVHYDPPHEQTTFAKLLVVPDPEVKVYLVKDSGEKFYLIVSDYKKNVQMIKH